MTYARCRHTHTHIVIYVHPVTDKAHRRPTQTRKQAQEADRHDRPWTRETATVHDCAHATTTALVAVLASYILSGTGIHFHFLHELPNL